MLGIMIDGDAQRLFGNGMSFDHDDVAVANTVAAALCKKATMARTQGEFTVVSSTTGRAYSGGVRLASRRTERYATIDLDSGRD